MNSSSPSIWDNLPNGISRPALDDDLFWKDYHRSAINNSIHVAILAKPYLEMILNLEKTVESRFSLHRRIPYQRVKLGDVILLKQTGGFIHGVACVKEVTFYTLESETLSYIRSTFGDQLRIQDELFWEKCEGLTYATLIRLTEVKRIEPIRFIKRDRNAWAVFEPKATNA